MSKEAEELKEEATFDLIEATIVELKAGRKPSRSSVESRHQTRIVDADESRHQTRMVDGTGQDAMTADANGWQHTDNLGEPSPVTHSLKELISRCNNYLEHCDETLLPQLRIDIVDHIGEQPEHHEQCSKLILENRKTGSVGFLYPWWAARFTCCALCGIDVLSSALPCSLVLCYCL